MAPRIGVQQCSPALFVHRFEDRSWPKRDLRWAEQKRRKGAAMTERDRYIPGVPCWVDTSQPDPEAAVQFYNGLFGWEFEDVMPPGADGSYYIGRIRGGDVAAVGSITND